MKTRNISIALAVLAVALAVGFGALASSNPPRPTAGSTPTPASDAPAALTTRAVADLSKELGIPPANIKVASTAAMEWPDGGLGCPEPGMSYAQVITPGYRIVLQVGDMPYEYHAGASADSPVGTAALPPAGTISVSRRFPWSVPSLRNVAKGTDLFLRSNRLTES